MAKFPEIPGYKIEKKLGESSLAMVFQGIQEDLDRVVAIKVLNPGLFQDKAFAERFIKEARDAIRFIHPNIANILEAGESKDVHYVVVEFLPESLRDRINRQFNISSGLEIERGAADFTMEAESETGEKLEGAALLDILKQLVWALDYAHKDGTVHKNIRPENIRFREDGSPTIVDFFVSKVLEADAREKLKEKGITYGSSHYGSPEQALRKPLDSKADIYSLGVVFYEMLTGKVPYDAPEPIAIENQHIMEPLPQLPDHLKIYQPLLDRMMAKEKEERIPGGIDLVQMIDEVALQLPAKKSIDQREPEIPLQQKIPTEQEISIGDGMGHYELPIQDDSKTVRPGKGIMDFLKIIPNPRLLLPIVGAVVIVILLVVVIKPFSSGDEGVQAGQSKQKPLTKEEQLELKKKERQFQHKFRLAKNYFAKGQYQRALKKTEEAEKFMTTPESKQMLEKIKLKLSEEKDNEAFKKALSAGTILAVEDYLKQFPSGSHVNEAKETLIQLKEEKKQREAERQRILDAMTKLRSQYKELSVKDIKSMLKKHGFFEKYYNKSGDFKNHFEVRIVKDSKIVLDFATGLIWHQFGSDGYMTFELTQVWLADLNKQEYGGYSDWRLPTLEEAASLLENVESKYRLFIDPSFASEQRYIWTGDTFEKNKAWVIDFYSGDVNKVDKKTNVFVRPVRRMTAVDSE